MAAEISFGGRVWGAVAASDDALAEGLATDADAELGLRHAAAALVVTSAALVLVVAPAAVALIAIVSPELLNRTAAWLLSGSFALSLVAAGRVPAAALLAAAWRSRAAP